MSEHASAAAPSGSLLGAGVRARSGTRATDNAWVLALRVVVGSRLLVWIAAFAAIGWIGENVHAFFAMDPYGVTAPFNSVPLDKLLAPVGRWDAVWYIQIAQHGYYSPASTNFFPLYPLLIALGDRLIDQPLIVGGLISLGCMTAGLALLYRLALLDLDEPAARLTVVLVSLYPMSLFLSAAYTESLFLLLAVGMFYAARRERWALAGLCGGLAAATRSDGVALVIPLALLYLYGPREAPATGAARPWWRPRYRVRSSAAWLALVPAGLVVYLTLSGSRTATRSSRIRRRRPTGADVRRPFGSAVKTALMLPADIHGLLAGTARSVGPGDPLSWNVHDLIDLSFFVGAAGVLATCRRRIPFPYLVYSLIMLAYASTTPRHIRRSRGFRGTCCRCSRCSWASPIGWPGGAG